MQAKVDRAIRTEWRIYAEEMAEHGKIEALGEHRAQIKKKSQNAEVLLELSKRRTLNVG